MNTNPQTKLVLRDLPLALWLFGLIFFGVGVGVAIAQPKVWMGAAIFGGIGAIILLFGARALTITLDRTENKMTLRYQALLWWSKKEIPLNEIGSVQVEQSWSSSSSSGGSSRRSRVYRVVLMKKDGTTVPLRSSFSSGESSKAELAQKIRGFIGVAGYDETLGNQIQALGGLAKTLLTPTGVIAGAPQVSEQVTNGVHWRLENRLMGASPITRWISTDFRTTGCFLLLSQKVGGGGLGGLLGGSLGSFMTQQALTMYGFGGSDTPGVGSAQPVAGLDGRLAEFYESLTSDANAARQIVTPWVPPLLVNWAQQNPAQQFQASDRPGPLMVLFSPNGLYLTFINKVSEAQMQALTQLGAELVRAQGTQKSQ